MPVHRRRRQSWWFVWGCVASAGALVVAAASRLQADVQHVQIREVMAGANGAAAVQFLVIQQGADGQNLWGPQAGESESRAMLVFYDTTGRETGIYKFPADPPTGGLGRTLVATAEFAAIPGMPAPDVTIPPLLNAMAGKVCFQANPATDASGYIDCVSYGAYTGPTGSNTRNGGLVAAGAPAASLPIVDTVSLRRDADTGRNADFQLVTVPTPQNIAGVVGTLVVDSIVRQGERLFMFETFGGNGRTCATCHVPSQSFGLQPFDVQARFATVSSTYDPLFVGEVTPSAFSTSDAGFDYNLNTLILTEAVATGAPCTGELRGIITSASSGGRGKVIARTSPTTYLVGGGVTPALAGTVTDGVCSGTVASVSAGSLGAPEGATVPGLEDPKRMRTTLADPTLFPFGRALFLENVDQLTLDNTAHVVDPHVFRKSPHLLNLTSTAPFGFSGDIADLRTFSTGAVKQHYPRTLVRSSGGASPDFRLPTDAELAALEAFQLAQEFPSGSDPDKYNLDRFVTSPAAIRGRAFFFGDVAKCSQCHGGPTLATMTVALLGQAIGSNGRFDTGVVNQTLGGGTGRDNLPCEPSVTALGACGTRAFSVPQLFNVKHLTPLFHDSSAANVRAAVAFYNTAAFNDSPAGVAIGGIAMPAPANGCVPATSPCTMVADIQAFLDSLVARQLAANTTTAQNGLAGSQPTTLPSVVVRDDEGTPVQGVTVSFSITGGDGSATGATVVTNTAGVATVGGWVLGIGTNTMSASVDGATGSPVTFTAYGATVAPSITTNPASQAVNSGSTTALSVAAGGSPAPAVAWQVSSDAGTTWTTLTNITPYTGATTQTLTMSAVPTTLHNTRYRAVVTNVAGTTTSAPATLTVYAAAAIAPASLRFSAVKAGAAGAITSVTSSQTLQVTFAGAPSGWTLTSDVAWLQITGGSGSTAGSANVAVVDSANTIGGSTSLTATLTATSARAGLPAVTVPVTLTVDQSNGATTVAPIGGFDSPTNGSTNVVGAIAVTGWALDDVGVERVEIWRNCLTPVDSTRPGVCRNATPTGAADRVFIGNAAFVPGARSDIEGSSAYTSYPQTYRAGWGYLLLTNALPNQTTGATEGGQGTVTLYAYAIDREGRYTELGSKVITLNNDNATVPFGAIDTPEQGGTITGALTANFGWAMTRRQNASGVDVPKCIERSRYRVFIDGVARTLTTGTNWHPNLSRSDLTAAYPGLCDSANSLAAYYIDVTALGLANGLHTIGWDVYDDNGTTGTQADDNVAGIGSRFFNILVGADAPLSDPLTVKPASRGAAADITALPAADTRELRARVGALEAPVVGVAGDTAGRHAVNLPQGSRLTVDLGGEVTRGYLVVGNELRDLPVGSTLDAATGHFYWQPAIPYFGAFELVFVSATDRGGEARTTLEVSITDPTAGGEPQITITSPRAGANPNPVITVTGTAHDPRAVSANGISAVHVWAYRKDVAGVPPQFLGDAVLTDGNYTMTTAPLQPGTYEIAVFAWVARAGAWAPAATVVIAVR